MEHNMEILKTLSDEEKERFRELLEKKKEETLTSEEAYEYGQLLARAAIKSSILWSV